MAGDYSSIRNALQAQEQAENLGIQNESLGKSAEHYSNQLALTQKQQEVQTALAFVKNAESIATSLINMKTNLDQSKATDLMRLWQAQEEALITKSIQSGETKLATDGTISYGQSVLDYREQVKSAISKTDWMPTVKQKALQNMETSFGLTDIQTPLTLANQMNKDATNLVLEELDGIKTASSLQPYESKDYSAYDSKIDSLAKYGMTQDQLETMKISGHHEIDLSRLENAMVSYGQMGDTTSVDASIKAAAGDGTITPQQEMSLRGIASSASSRVVADARDKASVFTMQWLASDKPVATMRSAAEANAAKIVNPEARKAYTEQVDEEQKTWAKKEISNIEASLDGMSSKDIQKKYDSFTKSGGSNTDILSGLSDGDKAVLLSPIKAALSKQEQFEQTIQNAVTKNGKALSSAQTNLITTTAKMYYQSWDSGQFSGEQFLSALQDTINTNVYDADGNRVVSDSDMLSILSLQNEYTQKIISDKVPSVFQGDYQKVTGFINGTLLDKFRAKTYNDLSPESKSQFDELVTWADSKLLDTIYQGRDGKISTQIINDAGDQIIGVLNGKVLAIAGKGGITPTGESTGGLYTNDDPFRFFTTNNNDLSTILSVAKKDSNSEVGSYSFPNEEVKATVGQAYTMIGGTISGTKFKDLNGNEVTIEAKDEMVPQFEVVGGRVMPVYQDTSGDDVLVDPSTKMVFKKNKNGLIPLGAVQKKKESGLPMPDANEYWKDLAKPGATNKAKGIFKLVFGANGQM